MAPRHMTSKFAGTCIRCQRPFPAGASITWAKGVGASHADPRDCAAAAAAPPPPPAPIVNLRPIAEFLMGAQLSGLKHPKARFLAPGGGVITLTIAGPQSKHYGSIQVYVDRNWVGRVEPPEGQVVGSRLRSEQALLDLLLRVATDPAAAAKAYGAMTGCCSFCNLPLSDAGSVEVGYGPVCAKKWRLPHQPKGTPSVQAVAS